MSQDQQLTHRIRDLLDAGVDSFDEKLAVRLHKARQGALARQRPVAAGRLGVAGLGNLSIDAVPAYARALLATIALVLGIAFVQYWQEMQQAAENAEVDSALLADEIHFNAYLDQDFLEWLDQRAQEEDSSQG